MLHKKENSIETIGIYNIYGTKVPKRLVWKTIKYRECLFHVDFFKNFGRVHWERTLGLMFLQLEGG